MNQDVIETLPEGANLQVWCEFCMIDSWEAMQRFRVNHPREYNLWMWEDMPD